MSGERQRRLKLQTLWALGQVVADIAKLLMLIGHGIVRLAYRLHDWAMRR